MNCNKLFSLLILALPLSLAAQNFKYSISADDADCMRKIGEKTTFTVTVLNADGTTASNGTVKATIDNFGPLLQSEKNFDISKSNPFTISGTLNEPGFLRLTLLEENSKRKDFSVGYEPELITKASPSPADFDEFWANAKAKLAQTVPLDPVITPYKDQSTEDFNFYKISFATFGRRVYGYLTVPKAKTPSKFPIMISVNSAGMHRWSNNLTGRKNAIMVQFSVFDWHMDKKWESLGYMKRYNDLNARCKKDGPSLTYAAHGISISKEDYFFYPVILGIDRAIDWLAKVFPVDKNRFLYQGTSQGGGFGYYLCALNKNFTHGAFIVPAITDTMGYLKNRQSGWPKIIEKNSHTKEAKVIAEKNAPYFDGANFASRITCKVRVVVGLSDVTCPPNAVYASYNEIPSKDKKILYGIDMTHSCRREFYEKLETWLMPN